MRTKIARRPRRSLVRKVLVVAPMMALLGVLAAVPVAASGTGRQLGPATSASQPVGAHPQLLTDQAGLSRLRGARTSTHRQLADLLQAFLKRYSSSGVDVAGLGAYALGAEVFQDSTYVATAKASLDRIGSPPTDHDLNEAQYVRNLAEAYDMLYNDLTDAERQRAAGLLGAAAADLAAAATSWWGTDFTNNHNWVNFAAVGAAGYALRGHDARADSWVSLARANQTSDDAIGNAVRDGSWHEGVGYQDFMLAGQIPFYLGAAVQGVTLGDTAMLRSYGRFALYDMIPGHARQQIITNGDWNWSRPGHAAILSFVAARYHDAYAQTAASLWEQDLTPETARSTSSDSSESLALQYVAYDPGVPTLDLATAPKDLYAADQQSSLLRTGFGGDDLAVGLKSGVFGGRGIFELHKAGNGPSRYINFGHDHVDDLSLFLAGRGGWYLPEAASYNCCTNQDVGYTTDWHNSFLVDGAGQLGDDRNSTGHDTSTTAPWFFSREASMPLHAGTAHYAFSRGDGTRLYPATSGLSSLTRSVAISRDSGYVLVRDAAAMSGAHRVDAVFHSQVALSNAAPGWLLATNEHDRLLGVRVLAPAGFATDIGSQHNSWEGGYHSHDADGTYAYARVHAPAAAATADFLDVLWPTSSGQWPARPDIRPLDASHPQTGATVPTADGREMWVLAADSTTTAGGLTLTGAQLGMQKVAADGSRSRLVLVGAGQLRAGTQTLLATTAPGPIEVAVSGTSAKVSGTVAGTVTFYGPAVTAVTVNGRAVTSTRNTDGTVTFGDSRVTLTSPVAGSTVSGVTAITATATADVAAVQFVADGRPIGSEDTTRPYAISVDTSRLLASGVHTVTARARTASGLVVTSAPVTSTVANPAACVDAQAGQTWPSRISTAASGHLTATATVTPGSASTVGGLGLGAGRAAAWADLAVSETFADDGTVAALGGDHYVSSGVRWTAGQAYQLKLDVDVAAHTYAAYVRPPGAATYTRIGATLHFRTAQQGLHLLDTATATAGIGSVHACGITVTTPADLRLRAPLRITPGQSVTAAFTVTNAGGSPLSIDTLVVGNRDAAGRNVDFTPTPALTLTPGQSYAYTSSRSLPAGRYTAWPAAQTSGSWRELGVHQAYTTP